VWEPVDVEDVDTPDERICAVLGGLLRFQSMEG
jgi:hypothetical protein